MRFTFLKQSVETGHSIPGSPMPDSCGRPDYMTAMVLSAFKIYGFLSSLYA